MKRTDLIAFCETENKYNYSGRKEERIAKNQCWVISWFGKEYALIKSYSTIVGCYSTRTGTLYCFDFYSRTTSHHISKARKYINASRITYLYRRSDRIIERVFYNGAFKNDWKLRKKVFDDVVADDFRLYIEQKVWNH